MKRTYFFVAVAVLQIILGSLTLLGAAQPVQLSQDVPIPSGTYFHFDFSILGTGRLGGNLSELQGRSFDFFVFDDPGYASFRDGSNATPPLFKRTGTSMLFELNLPGSGGYHVVATDFPALQELHVLLNLVVVGLKPVETIVAIIVLAGGLALVGASLMLSVWSWRRAPPAPNQSPTPSPDPAPEPSPDPPSSPQQIPQDPPDDNTRIY